MCGAEEEIQFSIDENGGIVIEAKGFSTQSIQEATKFLAELGRVKSDVTRPDQHTHQLIQHRNRQRRTITE